jgi:hypothetical protein
MVLPFECRPQSPQGSKPAGFFIGGFGLLRGYYFGSGFIGLVDFQD